MMTKLVAIGLATVVAEARDAALKALQKRAEVYAPWEESPTDLHKTYHNVMSEGLAPFLQVTLAFARDNGYGELSELYLDGLITVDEFFVQLIDSMA
jgi:hypothetical protein